MSKMYFHYSAMNAGKSTILLQASHNYHERGMVTLLLTAEVDDRFGAGKIASRIGLSAEAVTFNAQTDVFQLIADAKAASALDCVLIDEAQFLTEAQVWQLAKVADSLSIPIMCYGLRTDFKGQLFPGSAALLGIADDIREIKTICWCGRKATMNMRLDGEGKPVEEGEQVMIDGKASYVSLCRRHFSDKTLG